MSPSIRVLEPLWTLIPASKAILPVLWEVATHARPRPTSSPGPKCCSQCEYLSTIWGGHAGLLMQHLVLHIGKKVQKKGRIFTLYFYCIFE